MSTNQHNYLQHKIAHEIVIYTEEEDIFLHGM